MTTPKQEPKETLKPWGKELLYCEIQPYYAFKRLCITKGHRFSLQYHPQKVESWLVVKGKIEIVYNEQTFEAIPGDFIHVPTGTKHRIKALEEAEIIEVSSPHLEDIVRLEDDYNRI